MEAGGEGGAMSTQVFHSTDAITSGRSHHGSSGGKETTKRATITSTTQYFCNENTKRRMST